MWILKIDRFLFYRENCNKCCVGVENDRVVFNTRLFGVYSLCPDVCDNFTRNCNF